MAPSVKRSNTWALLGASPAGKGVVLFSLLLAVMIGFTNGAGSLFNVMVTGGMWALLAVGLALVFGVMNIPTFAHGESFMVGAYVGFYLFNPMQNYLLDHPNPTLMFLAPLLACLGPPWPARSWGSSRSVWRWRPCAGAPRRAGS
jgi:ABC-type branched-subunit amino acid transport system permease subunit